METFAGAGKKARIPENSVDKNRGRTMKQAALRPESYTKKVALVLQGGGALGSYQAGVYEALASSDYKPDWVAGISIGAINAALIAGNSPEMRVEKLREFWRTITTSAIWPVRIYRARPKEWMLHINLVIFGGSAKAITKSPEITVTGGLGDERLLHMYRESFAVVIDGAEDIRRYVRTMSREGCDIIKLNISGNQTVPNAPPTATIMTDAEIEAAVTTAHAYGKRVMSLARSSESVQLSLKHGIEFLNHCEFADDHTINMLEEHRERVFLAPAFGLLHNTLYEAAPWGITPEKAAAWGLPEQVENCANVYRELRKRGLRVLIGGDYGFAWTPHGTNARDLDHFVKWFGYTPEEALVCGTINGAKAMRMDNEIGRVRDGYLADLIIVRGRPHEDVSCLSTENILVVLKEGEPHGDFAWRISCATPAEPVALI